MSKQRDDGGPAFPSGNDVLVGDYTTGGHAGMTLRDYFIAHAPAEPQTWFKPVMPHPCPVAPSHIADMTAEEREDCSAYMEDVIDVGAVRSNRLAAYLREYESWRHWTRAWNADHAKQTYVQWPAAWADEMLNVRCQKEIAG